MKNILNFSIYIFIKITFFIIFIGILFYFVTTFFKAGEQFIIKDNMLKEYKKIEITIPENYSAYEIATVLEKNNFIVNKYFFYINLFRNKQISSFRSGKYILNNNMTTDEITSTLQGKSTIDTENSNTEIPTAMPIQ